MLRVEVDLTDMQGKPFLGGFRHTASGATYHHAAAQTARPRRHDPDAAPKQERLVQTVTEASRGVQTAREAGTQMAKRGLYLSTEGDRWGLCVACGAWV